MSFYSASANRQLKEILGRYKTSYQARAKASTAAYQATLKPGQQIPAPGLYGDSDRVAFQEDCAQLQAEARSIFDGLMKDLRTESIKPPTEDQRALLEVLRLRKNLTRQEVDDLAEQLEDNVQCYKALQEIAKESHLYLPTHPVDNQLKALEEVSRSVESALSPYEVETHTSDGYQAIVGVLLDEAIPVD